VYGSGAVESYTGPSVPDSEGKSITSADHAFDMLARAKPARLGFSRDQHIFRVGSGVIAIFRNDSTSSEAVIQPPLIPDGSYCVRSIIDNQDLGVITKEAFVVGV
jgi:hypothetical protein